MQAHNGDDIERGVNTLAAERNSGLLVLPSALTAAQRDLIVALAGRHKLPAVYPYRYFIPGGGLLSYGIEVNDLYRQAAGYINRILRGERPGDLPVQAPTTFQMVINLKAAKALGLDVPLHLQQLADELIE
jgi:putative ABC transport system substrate-binding protein